MQRTAGLSAFAILTIALLACGSMGNPPVEVGAGDAQNGQSVRMHAGEVLRLTLDTTAWTFEPPSDQSVLQPQGEAVVSPAPKGQCFPGMNCGTTTARFKALKAGTASVTATRLSCGEARRCVGPEGQYQLSVIVG
jgi:hypothetical protein